MSSPYFPFQNLGYVHDRGAGRVPVLQQAGQRPQRREPVRPLHQLRRKPGPPARHHHRRLRGRLWGTGK